MDCYIGALLSLTLFYVTKRKKYRTIRMDKFLVLDTVTEEFDQLSLLSTLATYVECNSEGRPGHSAAYMDRVTALRKVIEEVYGTEAMRFCGSDGC